MSKAESNISKLSGANMDIDLSTPADQIEWRQDPCPWNQNEGQMIHRCAVKSISICPFFCGVAFLDVVLCSYPGSNPYQQAPVPDPGMNVTGPHLGKAVLCEPILRSLPQWFGIEEANLQYLNAIEILPTFLASKDDEVIGFLTVREPNPSSAEIYAMGIRPGNHRQGIGRMMVRMVEKYLRERGCEYLQVKTLSAAHPDENYARTRIFYNSVGFKPLEEFPTLWGEANPCLQMIKSLR